MEKLTQSSEREATLLEELDVVRKEKETLSAFIAEKDRSIGEVLELLPLTQPSPEHELTSTGGKEELVVEENTRTDDDNDLEDWELFITQGVDSYVSNEFE
jgi:hypothetical protein